MKPCPVCGGDSFKEVDVLWPELVSAWQLSPSEEVYINRQQGMHCAGCGNNLRSMALADLLLSEYSFVGTLAKFVKSPAAKQLRVLEINEAGGLTPTLRDMAHHTLVKYPEVDIHKLPYPDKSFDMIIHSDTLEHVDLPVAALRECARVLSSGGLCLFTVPVVVGRLSRDRAGLEPSFHGDPGESSKGLRVVTEFGADFWISVLEAGFGAVKVHSVEYPAGLAVAASRPDKG